MRIFFNVRFGSKAETRRAKRHVRFTAESEYVAVQREMSALG
jgi:hypothetical protein